MNIKLVCNKIKLGYEWFWHLQVQTVPSSKGKHLSPHLPSHTEDTLWHHFLEGEFSPRGVQAQGPQLSLGRQGVQLRKKDFPK